MKQDGLFKAVAFKYVALLYLEEPSYDSDKFVCGRSQPLLAASIVNMTLFTVYDKVTHKTRAEAGMKLTQVPLIIPSRKLNSTPSLHSTRQA